MRHILTLLLLCLTVLAQDAPKDDIVVIKKGEPWPEGAETERSNKRVKDVVEQLPDGYSARLKFMIFAPGGKALRFPTVITPLNPDGLPDGVELHYGDWYRPPIQEVPFVNGKRHGIEKVYEILKDRVLTAEIPWVDGVVEGVKKTYHPNGQPASETVCVQNEAHGESRSWSPDGALLRTATFVKGKRHGDVVDYWPGTEQPQRSIHYENGEVEGEAKAWYASGQLKWSRQFSQNDLHGVERQYDAEGKLEKERWWHRGQPVTPEEFAARNQEPAK